MWLFPANAHPYCATALLNYDHWVWRSLGQKEEGERWSPRVHNEIDSPGRGSFDGRTAQLSWSGVGSCQFEKEGGRIDTTGRRILELTTDDDIEAEIDHADQYQQNIQCILSKLNKALVTPASGTEHTPRVESTPTAPKAPSIMTPITTDPPTGEAVTLVTPHTGTHRTKVKIPKLTLPCFSSNLRRWTAFWDSYKSAFHGNDELSKVQSQ